MSFWVHLMELLGDVGQVEGRFVLFGDSVNLDARYSNVSLAQKSTWMHLMGLLGDVGEVKAHFSSFGDSDNLDAR